MECQMLFSTKKDGNMSYKYEESKIVLANRNKWFEKNKIKKDLAINIKTVNKNIIKELNNNDIKNLKDNIIFADCVITEIPEIFLYLNFGDCIPCLIYDTKKSVMAMVHLGWISVVNNLVDEVVEKMINQYNCQEENLKVILGPSIKKESYLFENPLQLKLPEWKQYCQKINNDYSVDLVGYVSDHLKNKQIENITISEIDTYKDNNMFSNYRHNKDEKDLSDGRFICGGIIRNNN